MKIKIAQYIADFLVQQQIKHIFTITGGGAMHLNDTLGHHEQLTAIYNHHEQACAIAAEGYARLTGQVAAVCVTSGPGGTNAITGVVGGWQDSIPIFILSGQVKRETTTWSTDVPLRQLGDQEFQIVDTVQNMTKYAHMVTEPDSIRYHLEKAWYLCMHGRKGPVWLDIPLDVQAAIIETDTLEGFHPDELEQVEQPTYDTTVTKQIFDQMAAAKRPVILVGTGVRLSGGYESFLRLAEQLQIPIVTAWNAHDAIWNEHTCYAGRPGSVGDRGGNFVVQNADLLLVLGCRMNIRQISYNYEMWAHRAYRIVVDIDEGELQKPTVTIDMPVHADVKDVMEHMLSQIGEYNSPESHKEWLVWCKAIHKKYPTVLPEYYELNSPVNPYVFLHEFTKELQKDDVLVCGNGSACVITFQTAYIQEGQRLFTNSGCAAMGYGFPAALGCCVATEGKRVICIDGDGSFQMNLQELQTVKQYNLNMKIVILNNNGYHSIRQTQNNLFQPPLIGVCQENGVSFPSLEKLAYAYELPYVKIDGVDQIEERVGQFLVQDGPMICEVVVDENQNFAPKLSSKVMPDGTIVSPEIDDMYPFLPREEYEGNKLW
ncbi:MAG: thiamine pyrophosphate-binding protein [Eubacteriales bacterium]